MARSRQKALGSREGARYPSYAGKSSLTATYPRVSMSRVVHSWNLLSCNTKETGVHLLDAEDDVATGARHEEAEVPVRSLDDPKSSERTS